MTGENVLKPCPFCGGCAYLEKRSRAYIAGNTERVAYVRCKSCNARANKVPLSKYGGTKAEEIAIYNWNLRVELG